jgi:Xaa-Pro aminopeptidase
MRFIWVCLAFCSLLGASSQRPAKISNEEYKQRRAALRKATGDAVTILFGHTEKDNGDIRTGFFQDPNFYYLTGFTETGAILVLTPDTEVLMVPRLVRL